MKAGGMGRPEIGKLRTARWVEAPYSASAGTAISPIESRSIRVPAMLPGCLLAPLASVIRRW